MRLFEAGTNPTAVIAVGAAPTGVIAIGPLATGVIAIGQLARGVIVVGQLAIGVAAIGQLAVGVFWAGGQLALGAVEGPDMLGAGAYGKLGLRDLITFRWNRWTMHPMSGHRRWVAPVAVFALLAITWFVALQPLLHDLTRVGGVFRDPPRQLG